MSKRERLKAASEATEEIGNLTKDESPFVFQRDKIRFDLSIRQRYNLTNKQKEFVDLVMDKKTRLVFVDGPAGCSKTYLTVLCGLMLLNKRAVSDILYIRSIIESASKSLGSLPGTTEDKLRPFLLPLAEKLDEMLVKSDTDRLIKEKRVDSLPVNYLRGASFNARFIIVDEGQNLNIKEMTTVITRLGEFSKMVICGDHLQSDINGQSSLMKFYDLFNDEMSREKGIHCFSFTKQDIVRSGILGYIVDRLEQRAANEPMFPPPK